MAFTWSKYKGDFVSFKELGDSVEGTVLSLAEGQDFNGNPCPQLVIDTDEGSRTVTAGQAMLKAALAEKEPAQGDWISIEYYANGDGKPGRAPAKLFKVEVKRTGAKEKVSAEDLA